jgi:2,6-dihydroxypseudooxynicotine hydrolase
MATELQKLSWTPEAEAMTQMVPALFRDIARAMIERKVRENAQSEVTLEIVLETRDRMFKMLEIKEKPDMPTARDFLGWLVPRMMMQQVDSTTYWVDVDYVLDRITDRDSWTREWSAMGNKFVQLADEAVEKGHLVTARYAYGAAAHYYRWAHFIINEVNETKRAMINNSVNAYVKGGRLYEPPIERIEIPFGDVTLPGYFRPAPGGAKAPCLLWVHGADSTKEEPLLCMRALHERGLALATFDGPGQSEARLRGVVYEPEVYDRAVFSFIDYLQQRPEVDPERIGLTGVCFGGHLALRVAAQDRRVKACANNGGAYSYPEIARSMPPAWIAAFQYISGCENKLQELEDKMLNKLTLKGLIEKVTCPVLFVHATGDQFIPTSQIWAMYEKVGGPKEMLLSEGGDHCSVVFHSTVFPRWFDWIADRLLGNSPQSVMEQRIEKIESAAQPVPPVKAPRPELSAEPSKLVFTPEAEKLFNQAPFFLKKRARQAIEETARERGIVEITPELILEVRKKTLGF